jgi:hypothetical protein
MFCIDQMQFEYYLMLPQLKTLFFSCITHYVVLLNFKHWRPFCDFYLIILESFTHLIRKHLHPLTVLPHLSLNNLVL